MHQRQTAVDIVLTYQEVAAEEEVGKQGCYRKEAAKAYSAFCENSKVTAYMIGISDAKEVRLSKNFEHRHDNLIIIKSNIPRRKKVQRRQARVVHFIEGLSKQINFPSRRRQ